MTLKLSKIFGGFDIAEEEDSFSNKTWAWRTLIMFYKERSVLATP